MSKMRWVKNEAQLRKAEEQNPEFLPSTMRQLRALYETDPGIVAAVLPKPLEPTAQPLVGLTVSDITMHIRPGIDITIGAAVFGVQATYEGVEGLYLLTMPMTTEGAVVGGRETYGEPKKIAEIDFERNGDDIVASVTRQGIRYIEVKATIGESLGGKDFTKHAYCYKALPSCDAGKTFDTDPLLVRLEWQHSMKAIHDTTNCEINLTDSPFDPVADVPVRNLVSLHYEEGQTRSNGTVLRSVPGEWLRPFLHGRYDDTVSIMEEMLGEVGQTGQADSAEATAG
jgi:acetoacetate decarboxylase